MTPTARLLDPRRYGLRVHALQAFAAKLRHDIDAVRNAIREPWSNGQTEGQINRLKMLKRAMYGRASVALLCARMRPLPEISITKMGTQYPFKGNPISPFPDDPLSHTRNGSASLSVQPAPGGSSKPLNPLVFQLHAPRSGCPVPTACRFTFFINLFRPAAEPRLHRE